MKIKGNISILINQDYTTIELRDENAAVNFLSITLSPEQLSSVLSRLAQVKCDIDLKNIEVVGKKHEHNSFEFEIPKELASSSKAKELHEIAQSKLIDGWVADSYFASQGTFFEKDSKQYARCTIRRWV